MCGGILYALIIYIFGTAIDHSLVDNYKNEVSEQLEMSKGMLNETLYNKGIESLDHTTLSSIAFGDFFTKTIGGMIVSFITAAVYKKDKPVSENEHE